MAITRISAVWSGFRGAPGYSNFHFAGDGADLLALDSAAEAVRNFFENFRIRLPSSVSIQIQPTAEVIDEASGQILGSYDITELDPVTGGTSSMYSAATGAVVNWNTQAYRNGRRIRGRTFLVPLTSNSFDSQGDLASETLTSLRNGADYLASGTSVLPFVVWARPINGSGGTAEPVTSYNIPDLGAVLRSRRD